MKVRFFAAVMALVAGLALPGLALSSTIQALDAVNGTTGAQTVFSTLIVRNAPNHGRGQAGADLFLADPTGTNIDSRNFNWSPGGTTYTWSAAYDGTNARLTFGSVTQTIAVGRNMTWNAFKVYLVASGPRRTTATTAITVDRVNGTAATNPLQLTVTDNGSSSAYALIRFDQIASLSGTLRYSFQALSGSGASPRYNLAFMMEAVQLVPTGVPVPATLPLMLGGLAAFGALVRRRRASRDRA